MRDQRRYVAASCWTKLTACTKTALVTDGQLTKSGDYTQNPSPGIVSVMEMLRQPSDFRALVHSVHAYVTASEARSTGSFAGVSVIRVTPMAMNTAEPISSLREIMFSNACKDIIPACAKLDHVANAIRLRWADGLRDAMSKKMPSVT